MGSMVQRAMALMAVIEVWESQVACNDILTAISVGMTSSPVRSWKPRITPEYSVSKIRQQCTSNCCTAGPFCSAFSHPLAWQATPRSAIDFSIGRETFSGVI